MTLHPSKTSREEQLTEQLILVFKYFYRQPQQQMVPLSILSTRR
jgi:hypothetical protein